MADIFISYAHEDKTRVTDLVRALQEEGWSVFWDRRIPAGQSWESYIERNLNDAKCVVVVWSNQSVESKWVKIEATDAEERGVMVPVLLDYVRLPLAFRHVQAADLVNLEVVQSSPEFEKLISDISIILGPPPKHAKDAEKAEEEERKRKEAEEETERARKAEAERKAEEERKNKEKEAAKQETKIAEAEPSERKPDRGEPPRKSQASKIGVLIALVVVIGIAARLLFWPETPKQTLEAPKREVPVSETKAAAPSIEPSPDKIVSNSIGMKFVLVPTGSFTMGSDTGLDTEKPPHSVRISQSFYLQTTEVTQGQWKKVMGTNPSSFKNCGDDCPVENVSWEDAKEFIKKLNQMESGTKYRLPSEAEWEYACRAGTTSEYSFGDDATKLGEYAWYSGNSGSKTHGVSTKKPNAWGLYDTHGNVWEWVEDDWHGSYKAAPDDGRAWTDNPRGSARVIRGGSWTYDARSCRSALRILFRPGFRNVDVGFRLSRSVSLGP